MRPLLVYKNDHEIKHITYRPMLRYDYFMDEPCSTKRPVILFGCCGYVQDCNIDELIAPVRWDSADGMECISYMPKEINVRGNGYTSKFSIHTKPGWEFLKREGVIVVDMESYFMAKRCRKLGIKFISVRYVIDKCDRKVMPFGINWVWRKYQHRRMQLKMNKILKSL